MTAAYSLIIGLAVIVAFLGLLVVSLLRTQAEILRRLDGLGIRLDEDESSAPLTLSSRSAARTSTSEISGVNPAGDPVVKSLQIGHSPVLVAFLSTTCTSCLEFWQAFDSDSLVFHNATYRVLVVTLGPTEESPTRASKLSIGAVDVVMSSQAWSDFEVPGAPYFAVVDPSTRQVIGEGSAADMHALSTFLGDAAGDRRWDQSKMRDRTDADRERIVDAELRSAGLHPDDPRLYHDPRDRGR